MEKYKKYRAYETVKIEDRTWPNNRLTKAPHWCSVDLRDGNQALETPMGMEQKLEFFDFLVKIGFKEIEIGFPAASETEYEFTRTLIENRLIPDDVTVQVLTQSRGHIIQKTFEALKGAKNAIVHLYNSTSTLQRDVVFGNSQKETIDLAVYGASLIREMAESYPETNFRFEYSPESFTGTEMDFAAEICNAVIEVWQPTADKKAIINLPATVEMSMPNLYADQIEYMCRHLKNRENILVSVHAHNDRGTAVAATELGMLAGADRVEGTLFGNGERTGNADIMTVALNLFTQGIDPLLDFTKIDEAVEIYESSTQMSVHPRHPYAGQLVYTAFSGSHQDAIRKGMDGMKQHPDHWEVPYLPIDPMDVGRNYDPIIRINSQSGKGGVTFILEQYYSLHIPKAFQKDIGAVVTRVSDELQCELSPEKIFEIFSQEYVDIRSPFKLIQYRTETIDPERDVIAIEAEIEYNDERHFIQGEGNGVVSAFCHAVNDFIHMPIDIVNYRGHSMELGTNSRAISYIETKDADGKRYYGAGTSSSVGKSSLRAVVSTINKMLTV
ncbi:2-isopropylmalate synthase [Anaerotignum sp. MB30-C6]|uniref:2-isopropylmalate synthase n=1 Tax=Anaerotignum sp. MB30-C6 TaxID=3070814 RepID=UPI0027DD452F|nr:2-isopropylmalate synthase [Anaerotignum sp. MB30-C6]WMI82200.1 2-isopropylmalate synthase [Anaerotignum sp. MB30-C6]